MARLPRTCSTGSTSSREHGSSSNFDAEVVGYTTDRPVSDFVANLSTSLDTDVEQVDATHLEIRKSFTQAELEKAFSDNGGKLTSYQQGVSKTTADDVKLILENKINTLGTKDAKVNTLTGLNNVARYVRVELAGVDMNEAQQIVGKQGKFEIRIQTTGNQYRACALRRCDKQCPDARTDTGRKQYLGCRVHHERGRSQGIPGCCDQVRGNGRSGESQAPHGPRQQDRLFRPAERPPRRAAQDRTDPRPGGDNRIRNSRVPGSDKSRNPPPCRCITG